MGLGGPCSALCMAHSVSQKCHVTNVGPCFFHMYRKWQLLISREGFKTFPLLIYLLFIIYLFIYYLLSIYSLLFIIYYLFTFLFIYFKSKRVRDGERKGQNHRCQREMLTSSCLLHTPCLWTQPATQGCSRPGDQTTDLSHCRMMPNQLSHTGQGYSKVRQTCGSNLASSLFDQMLLKHNHVHLFVFLMAAFIL